MYRRRTTRGLELKSFMILRMRLQAGIIILPARHNPSSGKMIGVKCLIRISMIGKNDNKRSAGAMSDGQSDMHSCKLTSHKDTIFLSNNKNFKNILPLLFSVPIRREKKERPLGCPFRFQFLRDTEIGHDGTEVTAGGKQTAVTGQKAPVLIFPQTALIIDIRRLVHLRTAESLTEVFQHTGISKQTSRGFVEGMARTVETDMVRPLAE